MAALLSCYLDEFFAALWRYLSYAQNYRYHIIKYGIKVFIKCEDKIVQRIDCIAKYCSLLKGFVHGFVRYAAIIIFIAARNKAKAFIKGDGIKL